jgi:hypothetical protein
MGLESWDQIDVASSKVPHPVATGTQDLIVKYWSHHLFGIFQHVFFGALSVNIDKEARKVVRGSLLVSSQNGHRIPAKYLKSLHDCIEVIIRPSR